MGKNASGVGGKGVGQKGKREAEEEGEGVRQCEKALRQRLLSTQGGSILTLGVRRRGKGGENTLKRVKKKGRLHRGSSWEREKRNPIKKGEENKNSSSSVSSLKKGGNRRSVRRKRKGWGGRNIKKKKTGEQTPPLKNYSSSLRS